MPIIILYFKLRYSENTKENLDSNGKVAVQNY